MRRPHHVSSREIERKFLIKLLPPEILRSRHFNIAQGYLVTEPGGRHEQHDGAAKGIKRREALFRGGAHGVGCDWAGGGTGILSYSRRQAAS